MIVASNSPAIRGYFSFLKSGRGTKKGTFLPDIEIRSRSMEEFLALHQPGHTAGAQIRGNPSLLGGRTRTVTTREGEEENNRGCGGKARAEGCWRWDRGVAKGMTVAAQERTFVWQRDPNINLLPTRLCKFICSPDLISNIETI